jgi:glycogen operon protein
VDEGLLDFGRRLVSLRLSHPVFRRRRFLTGADADELQWFTPAGTRMTAADWQDPGARSVALHLDGTDAPDRADDGGDLVDDDFLLLVNAWWEPLRFVVPTTRTGQVWVTEIDTFDPDAVEPATKLGAADPVTVGPRSVVLLRGPRVP